MPGGTVPGGTMPDGTVPDGTVPDGTVPDGTATGRESSASTRRATAASRSGSVGAVQPVALPLEREAEADGALVRSPASTSAGSRAR
jgi:hypothetical protein